MKFKDFVEFIKLPPNILAAIALVSGIIILSPDELIKKLYMINFRNNYGFIISLIFLISISILFVLLLTTIYKKIKEKTENKRLKKSQKKYLLNADKMKLKLLKPLLKITRIL